MQGTLDLSGNASDKVARYAYLNAVYETGFSNPIDEAIRQYRQFDLKDCEKLAEIPYDFYRKRLTLLLKDQGNAILVTKGALTNVLAICSEVEMSDGINDVSALHAADVGISVDSAGCRQGNGSNRADGKRSGRTGARR